MGRRRSTGPHRDDGASAAEYGAILILVAALAAVFTVVALPERVKTNTAAAICQLFSGTDVRDCPNDQPPPAGTTPNNGDPEAGDDPAEDDPAGDGPATDDPPPETDPADPDAPGLDPNDPDVQAYTNAKNEADAADQALNDLNGLSEQAKQEIIDFLKDLVGITDIEDCLTKGDIIACISALAGLVPWGKVLKVLKKIPGAIKLAKKLKNLWDKLADARARKKKADDALDEAEEKLGDKVCLVKKPPNSFPPGTRVLLADGTTRPIRDIRVGDDVWATDPATGVSGPRPVTGLITGQGSKHLVTVATGPFGRFGPAVTATAGHPFWNPGTRTWLDAEALVPGTPLGTPEGRTVVADVRRHTAALRVHNLTVAGLHTYYVLAGGTPVLVHNDPPEVDPCEAAKAEINWSPKSVKTFGHTFSDHGKSVEQLADRARKKGGPQGRWPDQEKAAEFLKSVWTPGMKGAVEVDMPPGLGEVVFEDGTTRAVQRVRIVFRPNGMIKTAFPILPD
ncbi:polymorphic toxin-type HINT domain-containing protein [Actinocorallia libanotica]|uniref:Hint domain-containing protein n=1 Tax=Actinocorallia libanotica TaxID=46162 RepID=A0ABP4CBR0_9ACTN